jgi:putative ABC transport system permease protein
MMRKKNIMEKISFPLSTVFSMLVVIFKRVRHNLGLSISAILGIVAILSIVVAVPVFSRAISSKILRQELEDKALETRRGIFSLHLYHVNTGGGMTLDNNAAVTRFIQERFPANLGIELDQVFSEIQSNNLDFQPLNPTSSGNDEPWMTMAFFTLDDFQENAELVEGSWPNASTDPSKPIQVAVTEQAANDYLLFVGDHFISDDLEIEISGIWRPKNIDQGVWFDDPEVAYTNKLWIPREVYQEKVAPVLTRPIFYSSWYLVADENEVAYSKAPGYARGLVRLDSELRRLVSGLESDYSPYESLQTYLERAESLTSLIYAVSGPMVIMALLFIGLTASIAIQQYEQETATMRGRGTSWYQIVGLNLLESSVLILVSIPIALITGWLAASVISKTSSFLQFSDRAGIPFSLNGVSISWILLGAALVLIARFLPMLGISRTTIVRVKQEQARATKKPAWQRFFLDFFLLIPGIYAFIVLRGIYTPKNFMPRLQSSGGLYGDPLLFVAPSLFGIALCLIFLRFLPVLIKVFSRVAERLPGVWAYLAIQQISRRPQDHTAALLLIMISLALSIFSASTAKTLDQWQYDSIYYGSGSDLAVHEYAIWGGDTTTYNFDQDSSGATMSELDLNNRGYLSEEEHLKLPSVTAATRVGKYDGSFSYGVGDQPALIMGIDRLSYPQAGFFRDDFAGESLGGLMNLLGLQPDGVLVPSTMAEESGLAVGDRILVSADFIDQTTENEMVIVGFYDFFPTVYPSGRPTLIVNLESIFENPDSVVGNDVWLKVRENADIDFVLYQIQQLMGGQWTTAAVRGDAYREYAASLDTEERVGVFGILNVGFIVTALMPGIGFVLYSYAALRRRFIQLGILQAIGMSVKQLIGYLTLEQFLLMGLALISGAVIGVTISYLFVPLLQVNASSGAPVPPFDVLIGWGESLGLILAFGGVLVLTILGTILYLLRIKVFQAVKMGESL